MRAIRGWMTVAMVCCAAGAASWTAPPPDTRLPEAQKAFDEANTLWEAGQYTDSIARSEQALALREAMLGNSHPEVARCLDVLGQHLLLQGNPARAEPLLQRALAIREAALGGAHPEVAQTLNTLGNLYSAQWLYTRAEPLFQRALGIREATLGRNHPLVAQTLDDLARLYLDQDLYARAEPLLARALAIREAALGKEHLEVAQTLYRFALLYHQQGLYGRAEPLYVRALAIREAALGNAHPLVAEVLQGLAYLYEQQGLYTRAAPLRARALAIQETDALKYTPDVAGSLEKLASLYEEQGLYTRAEPLYGRALAIREATLGPNHLLVARSLYWLASHYQYQGEYGRAEPLLQRALAIGEPALGEHHPLIGVVLTLLGRCYEAQGLYAQAEPLLRRAVAIREVTFSQNHFRVAVSLRDLGDLYVAQGLYVRAEPLFQRALTILEAGLGKRHPRVADALTSLANLYQAQGLYGRARPLHERALAIREVAFGKNDPAVADSLNALADLDSAQGLYAQAEPLHERALALQEAALDKNHPSIAATLGHLAAVHLARHHLARALPLFARAFAISEQRLRQETLGFSEARLASFLQFLRTDEERLYALLRTHPEEPGVRRLALGAALLLKGRSAEETADISRTVYRSLGARDRDTFERLRGLRTQLSQLSLQGPGSLPLTAYQQRLHELVEQSAALEADLAQRSAPLRALTTLPSPAEIVDRVAEALPRDAALVEFIAYAERPLLGRPGAQRPSPMRYLALVLFPDATIRFRDLGLAEPIDSAASRLRDALANRDASFQPQAQALYQLVFRPLLPLLGETHHLFLSPDGQLSLVPFAALHDGQRFLVDTFDFTYLPSGKNLLPRSQETAPPDSVVVLADPDFSTPARASPSTQGEEPELATHPLLSERFFSNLSADLTQRAWSATPLPGTRHEAEAIQRLFPQAQLFLGAEATKKRLLELPTPGILHLATHGFFLEDAPAPTNCRSLGHLEPLGADPLAVPPPDPLLRSGLVFAGASAAEPTGSGAAPSSSGSALVTALELAGLNLWGTQLVVLSACDTGRGDVKVGQGVYGLRRAFLVAGAETIVMSLWKVDDETTRALMEAYYHHLLAGEGRAAALREAMREVRRTQPHPYAWAPFIAMGQDTPLRLPPGSRGSARVIPPAPTRTGQWQSRGSPPPSSPGAW